jgi:hypothetical protein
LALAKPMPVLPPVTRAVFPASGPTVIVSSRFPHQSLRNVDGSAPCRIDTERVLGAIPGAVRRRPRQVR